MAPIDMSDSVWGHSLASLYVSTPDLVKRDGSASDVLIVGNAGQLNFFNFEELQKQGSVPDYVKGLLRAATYISPWYKVQSDLHKLTEGYYILDNPNIFPIAGLSNMASYIQNAYSKFSSQLNYEQILGSLLKQLMYRKVILNTPVKINGEWKWVLIYPDPTWLPAYKKAPIKEEDLVQLQIEDIGNYPTRVFLQMNSGDSAIDKTGTRPKFLFSYPDLPYIEDGNASRIAFTDEEKYKGPSLLVENLTNMESYYSLVDWSKPVSDLRVEGVKLNEENGTYFNDLALYKFLDARKDKAIGSTIVPIHDPEIRPIFPVSLKLLEEYNYTLNIASVMYTFTPNRFDMSVIPESFISADEKAKELNWAPDEYKTIKATEQYYKQFSYELMTEEEYWDYNNLPNLSIGRPTYYNSSNLNAQYIINNSDKNLKRLLGSTIFSAERAKFTSDYVVATGGVAPKITIAKNQLNMNLQKEASIKPVSKGGISYEKTKESEHSFFIEHISSAISSITNVYPVSEADNKSASGDTIPIKKLTIRGIPILFRYGITI
jgi:hypothetical protein